MLDINIDLSKDLITWAGISMPMVLRGFWGQDNINQFLDDVRTNKVDVRQQQRPVFEYHSTVLEVNVYKAANLEEELAGEKYKYLKIEKRNELYKLLVKYKDLFQGKRGIWQGDDVTLELTDDATPYMAKPYPVPLPQRKKFKKELYRQELEGILRLLPPIEAEKSEWGFPMFGIPKKNKREIRTVGDFRRLNSMFKTCPHHIEMIDDMLASVGIWAWDSGLDLNMGYYAMKLCPKTRKFVCVVTIWGIYECLILAMGTSPASHVFQRRVTYILSDVKPVLPKCYIDDILAALYITASKNIWNT